MKLVLTNVGGYPTTFVSGEASYILNVNEPLTVEDEDQTAIIGDKPNIREQLQQAKEALQDVGKRIIDTIFRRRETKERFDPDGAPDAVQVVIQNNGQNAIRAILGDGQTEVQVEAGFSYRATAPGYIELRELGQLDPSQVDGGTQPSSAA